MDDAAIDVEHTGDDETPTKSGMRYQRGVFRSWPPTERKALSHYMLAYYLPSQRRTKLFKALVFGCGVALVVAFFSALSGCAAAHDVTFPVLLDTSDLTPCQREAAQAAIRYWNDVTEAPVFDEGPGNVVLTQASYEGSFLHLDGDLRGATMYVGNGAESVPGYECSSEYTIAYELGHLLGIRDDGVPGSLFEPGLATSGEIKHWHVAYVRALMGLPQLSQSTTACAQQDHYIVTRWIEVLVPRRPCQPREVTLAMVPVAFDGEVL